MGSEMCTRDSTITAPIGGKVARVAIGPVSSVAPGDLLIEIG